MEPAEDDPFVDPMALAAGLPPAAAVARLRGMVAAGRGGMRARLALGIALGAAGEGAAAVAVLHEAAMLAPGDADVRHALGRALLAQGEHREAIAALQAALRQRPDDPATALALGDAWAALGELQRAAQFYAAAARYDPGSPAAERLAALAAAPPVQRHTEAFVRHLFDGYAATYDADMRGTLGYCGPELLRDALAGWLGAPEPRRAGLDLGCGTGLCGPVFRPWLRRLDGVDLSPAMLARAAARGAYDRLDAADLEAWLAACAQPYDLVLAADVLNYLGDLGPTFRAVARILAPGGRFAFTAEAGTGDGFDLGPKRRFRHGEGYVRAALAAAGLWPHAIGPGVPRREAGDPVAALLVVAAARPDSRPETC